MDVTYRKERISGILEFLFWGYLMYSMISDPLGLSFPLIPGAWLSLLALASIFNVNWKLSARIPMLFILAISGMLVAVQCFVHQMPITTNYIWSFVMWIPLAMVIFLLSGRPGFIKRLAVVMFLIGLVFRFWVATKMDIIARQELSAGTIANANDYAAWMGFCALVFWLWSWKLKRGFSRLLLLAAFAASTYFLLGTVSRGALLSLVAGILIGLRGFSRKQAWLSAPALLGLGVIILLIISPVSITNFQARLNEDTGRLSFYPVVLRNIYLSPFFGYSIEQITHKVLGIDNTPHNGIMFVGEASGVIPAVLLSILWLWAIFRGFKNRWLAELELDALPLIIFAFLQMVEGNINFMFVWAVAALFYCFREVPNEGELPAPEVEASPVQPVPFRKFSQ